MKRNLAKYTILYSGIVLCLLCLTSCGQTGQLYLPDAEQVKQNESNG